MPKVHYIGKNNFEIVSQRFTTDNILVEKASANIKKKTQTFVNFYCRNMVMFSKFSNFVMFETKDLIIILINYLYHKCPIVHAENNFSKLLPILLDRF
jgi:hypothetical protein